MEPLVGIIVPVYNTAKYLRECLDSIKKQTYNNYVCIVVDDGSTDNSLDIANEYATNSSLRKFLIFNKQNSGVSSARNFALNIIEQHNINPEYICFVDSDDIIKPTFIETFIKNLIKNNADYAVCGYDEFDKNGIIQSKRRNASNEVLNKAQIIEHFYAVKSFGFGKGMPFKYSDTTYTWALYNKCFHYNNIKNNRFDETLRNCEDMKFFLEISNNLNKGIIVPDILYQYRLRSSSLVHDNKFDYINNLNNYKVLHQAVKANKPPEINKILEICLCRICYVCFYNAIKYMDLDTAKTLFLELNRFRKVFSKNEIEGELYRKIARTKYGYLINFVYIKYKLLKKRKKTLNKNKHLYP